MEEDQLETHKKIKHSTRRNDPRYNKQNTTVSCYVEQTKYGLKLLDKYSISTLVDQPVTFVVVTPVPPKQVDIDFTKEATSTKKKKQKSKTDVKAPPTTYKDNTKISTNREGFIEVHFVPPKVGKFFGELSVDAQIYGTLEVISYPVPKHEIISLDTNVTIGKPVHCVVKFSEGTAPNLVCYVTEPAGHVTMADIVETTDGSYDISFVPHDKGEYTARYHHHGSTSVQLFSIVVGKAIKKEASGPTWMANHPQFKEVTLQGKTFPESKAAKIVIIGAGPSGLSTAHHLISHGYNNLTILDSNDVVGGKSHTWVEPKEQVPHDMGTTTIGPTYDFFRKLKKDIETDENGLADEEVVPPSSWDGYRIFTTDPLFDKSRGNKPYLIGLNPWVFAKTEKLHTHSMHFLPDTAQLVTIQKSIQKYKKAVDEAFGIYAPYPMPPIPKDPKVLSMSFKEFIEQHCPSLEPLLTYGIPGNGYGSLENVPAYYGIYFLPPRTLEQFINPFAKYPPKTNLKRGWRHFWEKVVEFHKLNVLLNFKVVQIKRGEKVEVEGVYKGEKWTDTFDFLFVACPPVNDFPLDWKDEELDIFGRLSHHNVTMTLYRRPPVPDLKEAVYIFIDEVTDPSRYYSGNPIIFRDARRNIRKDRNDKHADRYQVGVQISLPGTISDEELSIKLDKRLKEDHAQDIEIIERIKWDYFYRFNKEDVASGYPWKLLNIQGRNKTAFVHASAAFESINEVIAHAWMLVDFFLNAVPKE